jgi:hypothetical protein
MPRRKPISEAEMNILASAIGSIQSERLRSEIAPIVWDTLKNWDKSLADRDQTKRWYALARAMERIEIH